MHIPHPLQTDSIVSWCPCRGTDIWAMIVAARDGDLSTIKTLTSKDPALVHCTYWYINPIRFAVRENHFDVVEYLWEQGAGLVYDFDESLLTIAQDRGYEKLSAFIESKLREQYQIVPKGDLIAERIRAYDKEGVKALVRNNPLLVHAGDHRGNQPIHWAVLTRQLDMMEWLLNNGADIHATRPDGARPLDLTSGDYYYRAWYRDLPATGLQKPDLLVGWLIARGAEYDISVAAKMGDYERVKLLLDEDASIANKLPRHDSYYSGRPLRNAAGGGFIEIVQLLLDHLADPNAPEPGITSRGAALHSAISRKHWKIVKLLLEHGADPNAMIDSSGNCLWMAKHVGAPTDIIDLLISYGASLTTELICYDGDLHALKQNLDADPQLQFNEEEHRLILENREMVELIQQYQPDILKQFSLAGFHDAVQAKWLMENDLDPNRRDWLGVAPLHRAAWDGEIEMASVYLEAGADINTIDEDFSSTPLGWAVRNNKKEMVEFLLSKGADPSLPNDPAWAKPLKWAERRKFQEIREIISRAV